MDRVPKSFIFKYFHVKMEIINTIICEKIEIKTKGFVLILFFTKKRAFANDFLNFTYLDKSFQ